ncbi:multidrug transporter [Atopomonas sediminilitoris]|uniref:multidrug transporter n=1 Tax=Atopomonas sediminilitoris TaxID=2919919 RepID=UPI001F4E74F7|nr:multidrug transporter [Atopomonas sediminilitoris]MCJ8170484.1 multidrug transporter [Atopomonas sediminilitoris]
MKLRRTTTALLAATAMTASLLGGQAYAEDASSTRYQNETPAAYSMIGDLVIARPLAIGATAIGAAAWLVALPFTIGRNTTESTDALVLAPGYEAFVRCLGCTSGYEDWAKSRKHNNQTQP